MYCCDYVIIIIVLLRLGLANMRPTTKVSAAFSHLKFQQYNLTNKKQTGDKSLNVRQEYSNNIGKISLHKHNINA